MDFLMRFFIYLSLLFCYTKASAAANRPKTVELALMSSVGNTEGLEYFVNLTVGTPGQPQTLIIDTGSSNTFLFASNVSLLASNASFCNTSDCVGGTFDPSKSSTFEIIDPEAFKICFMLGSEWFRGDYIRDAVQINDLIVQKLTFGLATKLKERFKPYTGIMGLGYSSNILHRKHHKMATPPTFVEGLVQGGAISSRLYSIYLNTLDQYGSILFGGIDTKKYKGQLTTLNLLRSRHKVDNINLYLEEVKIKPYNESERAIVRFANGKKFTTLIDTGTPDWQLPIDAYLEVVRNTAVLRLELADLFSQITTQDGSAATDASGRPMCWLRVVPQYMTDLITSSSVIRAGYWVFDLNNGQVSLAQANLGTNSSDVVPVEAGADGLEKAVNNNLRAEAQLDKVEGRLSTSVTYELSTATNTVGYATGVESYPTPTGTGMYDPSGDHSRPRSSNMH
ncbi:acid protease, partial [Aureobasidium melanogenum]